MISSGEKDQDREKGAEGELHSGGSRKKVKNKGGWGRWCGRKTKGKVCVGGR